MLLVVDGGNPSRDVPRRLCLAGHWPVTNTSSKPSITAERMKTPTGKVIAMNLGLNVQIGHF